jgi:hypothetical protein
MNGLSWAGRSDPPHRRVRWAAAGLRLAGRRLNFFCAVITRPTGSKLAHKETPMIVNYKAYNINAFEREPARWRAVIRRQDGNKIRIAVPPVELESVTTSADALTAESAIDLAKQGIDGGGMI